MNDKLGNKQQIKINRSEKTETQAYPEKKKASLEAQKFIPNARNNKKNENQKDILASIIKNSPSQPVNQLKPKQLPEISSSIPNIVKRYYKAKNDNFQTILNTSDLGRKTGKKVTPSPPKYDKFKILNNEISPPKFTNYQNQSSIHKPIQFSILDKKKSYTPSNID